jgi:prolyl-tRNA editing enzyme YbaK/EbsC (Cys-tRNA(Pro) deacylase)
VWPEAVERIAGLLRASGVEGRLEELLPGAGPPPGRQLRAETYEADAGLIVLLVPADRAVDERKLEKAVGHRVERSTPEPPFPFAGARVLMEQSVLSSEAVWLEAGSPRHILASSPPQIAHVTRAETADLLRER